MSSSTVYFVGVPIGNYEDITFRAIRILKEVKLILCEDTRETKLLLDNFLIKTDTVSYIGSLDLAYKKAKNLLNNNQSIAFVSDRGMPCISDPGAEFINYFRQLNFKIKVIPGVSAVTSAFVLSGEKGGFYFYGFLPKKKSLKRKIFEELLKLNVPLIFFESPYRINETLEVIGEIIPDKEIKIFREMTKNYEEHIIGIAEELSKKEIKGEIVLIV